MKTLQQIRLRELRGEGASFAIWYRWAPNIDENESFVSNLLESLTIAQNNQIASDISHMNAIVTVLRLLIFICSDRIDLGSPELCPIQGVWEPHASNYHVSSFSIHYRHLSNNAICNETRVGPQGKTRVPTRLFLPINTQSLQTNTPRFTRETISLVPAKPGLCWGHRLYHYTVPVFVIAYDYCDFFFIKRVIAY